jgi:lipase chaperone LimK
VKQQRLAWGGALTAGAVAIAIGVATWTSDEPASQAIEGSQTSPAGALPASKAWQRPAAAGAQAAFADPLLGSDLRQHIEALLLEANAAGDTNDPAVIKKRAALLVTRHFPDDQAVRAAALVERYIDYRVALGNIRPPTDPGDPRALRSAIEARDRVRSGYFAPEENEALFAHDAELDRYTLARLEIERNGDLSKSQKDAALREAEARLSAEQRAQRADATSHLVVAEQTAAFDAGGISDQARYAQRQAAHGDAAARNLAQLDREERDWQTRLGDYDAARKSGASEQDLQHMRGRLFSESEQLRLDGALTVRTQAAGSRQ